MSSKALFMFGTHFIQSLEQMKSLASSVASHIQLSEKRGLVLLDGPMGSGKTQFTRFMIEELGSHETCSPSFSIHHRYETSAGPVDHIDLYRLETEEDLESTGFWDLFLNKSGFVIIEWAQRLEEWGLSAQLPITWPKISLRFEISEEQHSESRVVTLQSS